MASVEDDGYAFQAKSLTTLPVEMLTRVLENASLEDALRFGQTNRDAFGVVSRNPNFANRACAKEFFSKPDTRNSIERICRPEYNKFRKSTEKFCRDKAQDYLCGRVFDDWANLIPLDADGLYAVPNGFEVVFDHYYYGENNCPDDVKILKIPDSVRAIYKIAPLDPPIRQQLKKVEGMKNVKIIGDGAFVFCYSLASITIPDSVIAIGSGAFSQCESLTSITIPRSVTKIEFETFMDCYSLRSITIPNTVTEIGGSAFYKCRSLASFTIPEFVTEIRDATFHGCSALESVTIPNSVFIIGPHAFWNCLSLKAVTLPNSLQKIGRFAFGGCDSLESITIPDGVTEIGQGAFKFCQSLTTVIIPNSVKKIGQEAFAACHSLTDVTIPYSLYKSQEYIFDEESSHVFYNLKKTFT